jgi:hypothetical protein
LARGEPRNRIRHVADVVGGFHQVLGHLQSQRGAVLQERLRVDGRVFAQRLFFGCRVADDLVIHVGDIHHVIQAVAAGAQPSPQNVDEREGAEVADVSVAVDGGTAGVHAHRVIARRRHNCREISS